MNQGLEARTMPGFVRGLETLTLVHVAAILVRHVMSAHGHHPDLHDERPLPSEDELVHDHLGVSPCVCDCSTTIRHS